MFENFGAPKFQVDALGTVRDSAGFSTGLRVQYNGFESPRLLGMDGSHVGLTLRQDCVFDRWNQPLNVTIKPFESWNRPLEPVFKPTIDPLDLGFSKKAWWER